ncbi:VanZ family protein [Cellulomonas hominis]
MQAAGTHRRALVVVLIGYLAAVVRITLWPEPADAETFGIVRRVIAALSRHGVPLTYAGVEAAANVVMFVPFGVLVSLVVPFPGRCRRWRVPLVVIAGMVTSAVIELSQLLFLPTRVATIQDVALNTLGTALGVLALRLVQQPGGRGVRGDVPDRTSGSDRRTGPDRASRSRPVS